MFRSTVALFLCALLLAPAVPTHAYTLQYTNTLNAPTRWAADSSGITTINVALSTSLSSPPATVRASGAEVVAAARRALAQWEAAANIRFNITTTNVQSIALTENSNPVADGVSVITVADTPDNRRYIGNNALGKAALFFNPANGVISESDIVLSPTRFFSADGSPQVGDPNNRVYDLETTFAHEIGHLLGLGHAANIGATMNVNQGENPTYNLPASTGRSISDDDRAGVRAIYGAARATGAIAGTVRNSSGATVFGAHVWVEDATTGQLMGGNVTLSDGSYNIGGLLPGAYTLKVEALDGANAELASFDGIRLGSRAYSTLGLTSFQTYEMPGQITVISNSTLPRDITLNAGGVTFNPQLLGVRDATNIIYVSAFSIPFAPNTTRILYVYGSGVSSLTAGNVSISSPYLTVDPASFGRGTLPTGDGREMEAIRFNVTARADAPGGEYSIRLRADSGEVAYLPGALTIEPNSNNVTPPEVQTDLRTWTVQGAAFGYVRLTFPNSTYRVAARGQVTQAGAEYNVTARIERESSTPGTPFTTAMIYNLGPVAPGTYGFAFQSNHSTMQRAELRVTAVPQENVINNPEAFARQQYRDFLNREPDAPGLAHWTGEITSCGGDAACIDRKRVNTSGAFFLSLEHQATGYFVYRVYKGALDRQPLLAQHVADASQVAQGIVVNNDLSPQVIDANKLAYARSFVTRPDFLAIYGNLSSQSFVTRLFETTKAPSTSEERSALVAELDSGLGTLTERRGSVLLKVVDGQRTERNAQGNVVQVFTNRYGEAFYRSEFNSAFVLMQYFGYLRRDPDAEGYAFWLQKLKDFNGDFTAAQMVRAFIVSDEYRSRFGQP